MGTAYVFLNILGWIACLSVVAWGISYGITQWRGQGRGQRLASNRAFDRMVDEYRREQNRL